MNQPTHGPFSGQAIGRYTVGGVLDSGAFSTVYEASETITNRPVALKILTSSNANSATEFDSEAELLQRFVRSSNIITLHDSNIADVAMLFANGQSFTMRVRYHALELGTGLSALIPQLHTLTWSDRFSLWRDVVKGVHQMHLKGVVHRDLKIANCIVFGIGQGNTVCKVGDLGRSRDLGKPPIHIDYSQGLGDLRFSPPEFLYVQGLDTPATHRAADIYGLGSLLYEIVAGVGITASALGTPSNVIAQNLMNPRRAKAFDLSTLRPIYEVVFQEFERMLPSSIRQYGSDTLRRWCDPDPARRNLSWAAGSKLGVTPGLETLLTRADILLKLAKIEDRSLSQRRRA